MSKTPRFGLTSTANARTIAQVRSRQKLWASPCSHVSRATIPPQRMHALLSPALAGRDMGMLSDAGCPGVADPGALLVAAAHDAGIKIVPLVGPSAVLLALMVSGMNGQAFTFHGYLPVKPDAR